jgi:hypothetical protein
MAKPDRHLYAPRISLNGQSAQARMLSALTYAMCLADAHVCCRLGMRMLHSCVLLSSQGEITVLNTPECPSGTDGSGPRACAASRAAILHSRSIRDLTNLLDTGNRSCHHQRKLFRMA